MAYYYPVDYPYQPYQPKTIIDRVQGEASANVYPVQAGQEVILFDVDNPYVYRKERGLDNKLTQKRFRLVEDDVPAEEPKVDLTGYVKAEDVAQMISDAVEKKLSEYNLKPTKKKVVEEE
jgi:hypothetical protein